MTITVRLPAELEKRLRRAVADEQTNLSDFIRVVLEAQLDTQDAEPRTLKEAAAPVIGAVGSGCGALSQDVRRKVRDKIAARNNR